MFQEFFSVKVVVFVFITQRQFYSNWIQRCNVFRNSFDRFFVHNHTFVIFLRNYMDERRIQAILQQVKKKKKTYYERLVIDKCTAVLIRYNVTYVV